MNSDARRVGCLYVRPVPGLAKEKFWGDDKEGAACALSLSCITRVALSLSLSLSLYLSIYPSIYLSCKVLILKVAWTSTSLHLGIRPPTAAASRGGRTGATAWSKWPLGRPQLGSCASSGRAWRLRAARDAQGERPGHWSSTATEPAAVAHLGAAYKELVSIVQVSQP